MYDKISEQIKECLRAKDTVRLTTLRGMLAAFTNESVALKRTPQDKLSDNEATTVIRRLVKQRRDSIEQFEKGQRSDLADIERSEMRILEEFLPAPMSEEKIREIVVRKLEEIKKNGSTSSPQVGQLMGAVIKETGGQADGAVVKKIVEEVLG